MFRQSALTRRLPSRAGLGGRPRELGVRRIGAEPADSAAVRSPARLAIGWLTVFVVGTDLFVLSPLLPRIAADCRVSPTLAGLCVTLFAAAYVVAAPLLGQIADNIGRRRILIGCLAAFAAANFATGLARNLVWLLIARLVAGAAAAGVSPSVYALVAAIAPADRRATWLSRVVSGLLLSLTFGAPIAALAGAAFGWPRVFAGLALASLGLVFANRAVWPPEQPAVSATAPAPPPRAGLVAARLAPMIAWSAALYGMYTYLGTGLSAAGFPAAAIARAVGVYGAGAIGGLLLGGLLADRLGTKITAGISLAGLFICLLLLRIAIRPGVLADAALGLTSAVAQLFFPAQQAGLVNDFPSRRAAVLAWNNSILFLGISLGSLLGGQAMALGGFEANLTFLAVVALIGWAINYRVVPSPARAVRRRLRPPPPRRAQPGG
jgi:predicted MFS family arabinose efflux permease